MTNSPDGHEPDIGEISAEAELIATERTIFFSDAVVAIAITLLALALPVPHGGSNGQVLQSMYRARGAYLAFLISFVVIGNHWRVHHRLFRHVARLDARITTLNLVWLLMVVITPFATRVLAGNGGFGVRFSFYAIIQVITIVCVFYMGRYLRRHRLMRQEPADFAARDARLLTFAAMFLISIPIAFVTGWAFLCWVAAPLVSRGVRQLQHRHQYRHNTA